jgi:F-type H+-transporting ATPase subunit c
MKRVISFAFSSLVSLVVPVLAFAEDAAGGGSLDASQFYAIAAGFGIAIAAFGGALGQGKAIAAALEGISRNPSASGKIQTPMIIGLALIESLVIYAFVIAFMILGKI